ncbi:RNA 2',3'-cyclic phosphodiesterase [Paenibacillus sp. KQZ6P-2]|uniref:RNA 2',3'-cyclic phosphodiesterase n=1 Tax=Paenibacillus mangrovi TaxID=2931978 RepID=A0A9X1WTN6_9BACL|nr:RNA 2',3'-cyclic phosphodiesterase [Paenibacillus mangrovi]MCJ8014391.1 RNA 2',3'-cyclic phosphodiesterase [Paenibacillus mangrovi]
MNQLSLEQPLRLFIAVKLSGELKSKLEKWRKEQQPTLSFKKWAHREDYHITIQFLGDVNPTLVPDISKKLQETASQLNPFVLGLGEVGVFGTESSPRVLWAGVIDHNHMLIRLQEAVTHAMEDFGFVKESRPYRPHITIARKYAGNEPFQLASLPPVLPQTASLKQGEGESFWTVNEFALFSTHLHDRPMYEILESFRVVEY